MLKHGLLMHHCLIDLGFRWLGHRNLITAHIAQVTLFFRRHRRLGMLKPEILLTAKYAKHGKGSSGERIAEDKSMNEGQGCSPNPQAGMPALRQ